MKFDFVIGKKMISDGIARQIGPFPISKGQENQSLYQAYQAKIAADLSI